MREDYVPMKHMCPVCGFPNMAEAPQDYEICPCCGTEFGLDDFEHTHEELRKAWMGRGAPWFSKHTARPAGWNALDQLVEADILPSTIVANATSEQQTRNLRKPKSIYQRSL
jgi:hypothetical protein